MYNKFIRLIYVEDNTPRKVRKAADILYDFYDAYITSNNQETSIEYIKNKGIVFNSLELNQREKNIFEEYINMLREKRKYNSNLPQVSQNIKTAAKELLKYYIKYQRVADDAKSTEFDEQQAAIVLQNYKKEIFEKLGLTRRDKTVFEDYIQVLMNNLRDSDRFA